MSAPRVSVVVAFLNAERFLRETLDSVFAQTLTDWELILVDDGSTDSSAAMARDLKTKGGDRVSYLEHEGHANAGVSASRNLGIEHAGGEWIALLDSDDVWLPNKLERQLAIATQQRSVQLIFGRAEYWRGWDGGRDEVPELADLCGCYEPPQLLLRTILGALSPPPPSDILFCRDLWSRVGGFEPEFPGMYEDQVFLSKCMAVAAGYVAPETWTRYRRHESSMEAATDARFAYKERLRFLRRLHTTFAAAADPRIRQAVERLTWPSRSPRLHRVLWETRRALGIFRA